MLKSWSVLGFLVTLCIAISLLQVLRWVATAQGLDDHSLCRYLPSPIIFCLGLAITSYTTLCRNISPFLKMHHSSKGNEELLKSPYADTTTNMLWNCVIAPSTTTCVICMSTICLLALRVSVAGLFGFALFNTTSQVGLRQNSSFPNHINATAVYLLNVTSMSWQQTAWSLLPNQSILLPNFTSNFGSFSEVEMTGIDSDIMNASLQMVLPVVYSNLSCSTVKATCSHEATQNLEGPSSYIGEVVSNLSYLSVSYVTGRGDHCLFLNCQSRSYRYVKLH
jgi:hypothetical protein